MFVYVCVCLLVFFLLLWFTFFLCRGIHVLCIPVLALQLKFLNFIYWAYILAAISKEDQFYLPLLWVETCTQSIQRNSVAIIIFTIALTYLRSFLLWNLGTSRERRLTKTHCHKRITSPRSNKRKSPLFFIRATGLGHPAT